MTLLSAWVLLSVALRRTLIMSALRPPRALRRLVCYQTAYAELKADIVTMAKGICNGYPMGALICSPEFKPSYGMLGTTFGGNHLGCAGAIAVLEIFEKEQLVENARKVGEHLLAELKKIPGIKEVRGRGLMIGLEFDYPVKELRSRLIHEQHVFTGASGTQMIRLLPPLVLTIAEADEFVRRLKAAL